jgi:hypothetical protein
MSWAQYASRKVICAAPIIGVVHDCTGGIAYALVDVGDGNREQFRASHNDMMQTASMGKWAIIYPDGFRSISPADAFEDGYVRISERH